MLNIEHVVVVMMENRSFDEYFGTFPGANGFFPASAPMTQPLPMPPGGTLSPFRTSTFTTDAQDAPGLNHDWGTMHEAIGWPETPDNLSFFVPNNEPLVMGYFVENDLPYHWALARTFALCDNYFCSALAGTYTNRMFLVSGTIDTSPATSENGTVYAYGAEQFEWFQQCQAVPPPLSDQGPVIYNIGKGPGFPIPPCVTVPWGSYLSDLHHSGLIANGTISYRVYDDWNWLPPWTSDAQSIAGSAGNNLNVFLYFNDGFGVAGDPRYVESVASALANPNAPLQFELDAASGNLPTVAWIHPPYCLSEHPPFTPADGAQYLSRIVDAVISSPQWLSTVLVIVYDETDTRFDHVIPPLSPDPRPTAAVPLGPGQAFEPWVNAGGGNQYPYDAPIGAGMRVPAIIVSPWTFRQGVIGNSMDHTSILRLMERVTHVTSTGLPKDTGLTPNLGWRRSQFANLYDVLNALNSAPAGSGDIDRSLTTGVPTQATVAEWRTNAWARLSQLGGSPPAPPTGQPAPVAQACAADIAIPSYDYQQVTVLAGSNGTATFADALTVTVVGFEPTELTAPDNLALGSRVEVQTPGGQRWIRVPTVSIIGTPPPGDLQFACTGVNVDPTSVQTEPGVPYPFIFTYSAVFNTPATTFDFAGTVRVVELMAAFQVDATVVSYGQILLVGGTMPPQPVSTYQTIVDQLTDHPDNPQLPVHRVHSPKVLMALINPTTFPVDNPGNATVTYTHLFEVTGTAEFNYFNNGSGQQEYAFLQFDLPDALADLTQPDQEAVPVPPGSPPSPTLTPAPLIFKHPGFSVPNGAPQNALFVLDRFTTVASPASVSAQDTPLAWAADWSAAHYDGETGRVALTVQLALLGGHHSGQVSLLRVAYRVSFLAFVGSDRTTG